MMIVDQPHQPLLQHMGVDLRGRDVGVAEQLLHGAQIGAPLQQMAGKRVAQDMRRDPGRLDAGGGGEPFQLLAEALAGEMMTGR